MGRFWTAANMLSLSRVVLVIPITWLVWRGGPVGPLSALAALAIATDFFDGRVARWSRTVSEWGKVLDAVADKAAAAAVCVALLLRPESAGPRLPFWFVALVLARDLVLTVGGLVQSRRIGRFTTSLWSGKVAVTLLSGTVLAVLLALPTRVIEAGVWGTAAVMLVSLVEYAHRFRLVWRLGPAAPLDVHGHLLESGGGPGVPRD
jgi:CDP-diacylglycerol--glycerol-3-phosphate 3-phosphatidyltransferase